MRVRIQRTERVVDGAVVVFSEVDKSYVAISFDRFDIDFNIGLVSESAPSRGSTRSATRACQRFA